MIPTKRSPRTPCGLGIFAASRLERCMGAQRTQADMYAQNDTIGLSRKRDDQRDESVPPTGADGTGCNRNAGVGPSPGFGWGENAPPHHIRRPGS